jgi:hypothetical protein
MKTLFKSIQQEYPNEWVLIADPVLQNATVTEGVLVFHHQSKKAVLDFTANVIQQFNMVKIVFTGELPKISRLGLFKVIEQK